MRMIDWQAEYGPFVWCDDVQDVASTRRPAKSNDPWFCIYCGETDHRTIDTTN
jgi:hypothetical protein